MSRTLNRTLTGGSLVVILLGCADGTASVAPRRDPSHIAEARTVGSAGLLPDLRTVVPQHLQLVNPQQREILRFSNGIANTGSGALHLRPLFPFAGTGQTQDAIQTIFDASGAVAEERVVSRFEFHPDHNHWHIDAVALFELRAGTPTGPVVGGQSVKTTFCLVDWYALEGPSKTPDRAFFDCSQKSTAQGISPGWVDQYHHSIEGQSLELTGAPAGLYYLVSTANPDRSFIEQDATNNTAWVSFRLDRPHKGNPTIAIVANSPCEGALCGVSTNR